MLPRRGIAPQGGANHPRLEGRSDPFWGEVGTYNALFGL